MQSKDKTIREGLKYMRGGGGGGGVTTNWHTSAIQVTGRWIQNGLSQCSV